MNNDYGAVVILTQHETWIKPLKFVAALVAELFGTFLLVFTVGCCMLWGYQDWNYTAIGFMLMALSYEMGSISGAHFNPALSIAVGVCGRLSWPRVASHVVVQCLGAVLAGSLFSAMFEPVLVAPNLENYTLLHTAFIEIFFTCMLCLVHLNCQLSMKRNPVNDNNNYFGLAVGFVYIAAGHAGGDVSGACLNPAIALGLSSSGGAAGAAEHFKWTGYYTGFEVAAGVLAAVLFHVMRPEEFQHKLSVDEKLKFEPPELMKFTAEFVATFFLCITFVLNVVMNSNGVWWSAAAAFISIMYALGDICVGFLNPAAVLALVGARRLDETALLHLIAQLSAGLTAGFVAADFHRSGTSRGVVYGLRPKDHSWPSVIVGEAMFTFFFCFTLLTQFVRKVPLNPHSQQYFPNYFAVGCCIVGAGFAVGSLSMAPLNPAVSLALAAESLFQGGDSAWWFKLLCYSLVECGSACGALLLFFVVCQRKDVPHTESEKCETDSSEGAKA